MPLTNAEKQKAHRQRQREKMARYETALDRIADAGRPLSTSYARAIADTALRPTPALHIES